MHLIESYSHGMRQKLIMASVFMLESPLIIVDEPTAGLDPEERNRFLNLLSDIPSEMVKVIQSIIILLITAEAFLGQWKYHITVREAARAESASETVRQGRSGGVA